MRAAMAATLVALAIAAPAQAAGPPAVRGAVTHPLWGSSTRADNVRELDLLEAAGADSVRIDMGWSTLEFAGAGQRDAAYVAKADQFFADARARGLEVVVTFWTTPCWASSAPAADKQNCTGAWWDRGVDKYPPTDPADYARAAAWVADRWGPDISAFEVWNEPNWGEAFAGPDREGHYAALLQATYPAVKAESPATTVLGGSILMSDEGFLQAMYDLGSGDSFDAIAMRPYNFHRGPYDTTDPFGTEYSYANGVPRMRQVMVDHGDAAKEIWFTEIGWSSCKPGTNHWCVTQDQQAEYIGDAFRLIRERWPFVGGAFVYSLRNTGPDLTAREDQMGMVLPDFTPKPSYRAFEAVLAELDRPAPPQAPPPIQESQSLAEPLAEPVPPRPAEQPAPSPPDSVRPSLRGVAVVPRAFAPRRGRRGAAVVLRLSEPATVEMTLKRRRGRGWVPVRGTLRVAGGPGPARLVFGGFVDGRRLAPGVYALRAVAVDGAGNRSRAVSARFRVSA
jgi:hypothetical protein